MTEKYEKLLPGYPGGIYDYYRLNRLVSVGVTLPDAADWNRDLSELNADLGAKKQANTVIVVVKNAPNDYYYALEQSWIGGKKNDIILVVSVDEAFSIQWTEVMAWTDNKIFQVTLRDQVNDIKVLDRPKVIEALKSTIVASYVRKPMKDFEYLKGLIKPTTGQWIFSMIFGFILSIGLGIFFLKNDVYNEEYEHYGYRRRRW